MLEEQRRSIEEMGRVFREATRRAVAVRLYYDSAVFWFADGTAWRFIKTESLLARTVLIEGKPVCAGHVWATTYETPFCLCTHLYRF